MSAAGDARRRLLGDDAVAQAHDRARSAPPLTDALRDALAVLLRRVTRPPSRGDSDSRDAA